jgi:hypothetical protein
MLRDMKDQGRTRAEYVPFGALRSPDLGGEQAYLVWGRLKRKFRGDWTLFVLAVGRTPSPALQATIDSGLKCRLIHTSLSSRKDLQ